MANEKDEQTSEVECETGFVGTIETGWGNVPDEIRRSIIGTPDRWFTRDSNFEDILAHTKLKMNGGKMEKFALNEPGHLTGAPLRPYTKMEQDILKEQFPEYRCSDISVDGLILLIEKNETRNLGSFYVLASELKEVVRLRKKYGR